MRYFQPPPDTRFYAGVDLHARSLFLVVLDHTHKHATHAISPPHPEPFRKAIAPFRDGLVVGCECMHCWYWLADTCRDDNIAFVLGHAWGMKAVHGSKTKCDRKDAEAIAHLLKGGNFPLAYAYPKERRGLRDLLRARLRLVRQRAELYGHVHTARRQLNLPPVSNDVKYQEQTSCILSRHRRCLRASPRRGRPVAAGTAGYHHPPTGERHRGRRSRRTTPPRWPCCNRRPASASSSP